MRILVITQKIDKEDSVLGFMHGWLSAFSRKFEKVTAICLFKGVYSLPDNVSVLSLGKEVKKSRLRYLLNFYKYIWRTRGDYESVFIHMNQEYVLLGGIIWKILGKKVTMWRNHPSGSFLTYIAVLLCDEVFCTSRFSYTARFKKTKIMPVGIDLDKFKAESSTSKVKNSILFLGRIAPVKRPDLLIDAVAVLAKKNMRFKVSIYGDPLPKDGAFYEGLKVKVSETGLDSFVKFYLGAPHEKTPEIYNQHEIFVNLSPNGMYDKTIFEAMACGCIVLASNENLRGNISDDLVLNGSKEDLVYKLEALLNMSSEKKETLRIQENNFVSSSHSLKVLTDKLFNELS